MLGWFFDEVSQQTTGTTAADFTDPQWQVDVLAPYAVAQAAQVTLAELSPPSSFAASHELFVQSVDELVLAQTAMERGVLSMDLASINEATDHINRANELMGQATEKLPA
jgi:hypothetical protein